MYGKRQIFEIAFLCKSFDHKNIVADLFSGEEALKQAKVLSGGEKVRCMLAKMMFFLCKSFDHKNIVADILFIFEINVRIFTQRGLKIRNYSG